MSEGNNSDSSTSESEVSHCSSNFEPLKALYSAKTKIPVAKAPMYENLVQYEAALRNQAILPVGQTELVQKREKEKQAKRQEEQRLLEEKNKQRFAQYKESAPVRKPKKAKNVLTRIESMVGPLAALKECVDNRLRIKFPYDVESNATKHSPEVITRHGFGLRGELHATLVAFDKQWNLALSDVLEIWTRKSPKKRKIPPAMGTPVPKGTAATISPVPVVTEKPLGGGIWECTRHIPQLMMRGEHVVLINIIDR